nr:MAG TPA: HTH-type transcriptional regulator [Caudoviricetes sp.]
MKKEIINDLFDHVCPDCGCRINRPNYNRENTFSNKRFTISNVYIECPICGFRTSEHNTVRDCYKEWNECEL